MISVGFTGTRRGMTDAQRGAVRAELEYGLEHYGIFVFTHGDCVGADAEAHTIAISLGIRVEIRPCHYSELRAYCTGAALVHPVADAHVRNRAIVDGCHSMIAAPHVDLWEPLKSGGTRSTIRYGLRKGRRYAICLPSGAREYR